MNTTKSMMLFFTAFGIFFLTSCTAINERTCVYIPEPSIVEGGPLIEGLFIETIRNDQPQEENLPFNPNNDPWILLPFCFYSSQKVDPIVKRNFFQNDLDAVLQRLFVKDLRASNISKEITVCKSSVKPDLKKRKGNYRLQLVLKHAVWNRNITAYGLSYPGTFLWTLGFPMSYGNVQLEIDAILYSPDNSKDPIAKKSLKKESSCIEFIYDQIDYQPSVSEGIMAKMFPEMAKDLRNFLSKNLKK